MVARCTRVQRVVVNTAKEAAEKSWWIIRKKVALLSFVRRGGRRISRNESDLIAAVGHSHEEPRWEPPDSSGGEAFKPRKTRIFLVPGFSRGVPGWEVPELKPKKLLGDCSLATLKHCPTHKCMGSHPKPN